jgi:hypothetical protein
VEDLGESRGCPAPSQRADLGRTCLRLERGQSRQVPQPWAGGRTWRWEPVGLLLLASVFLETPDATYLQGVHRAGPSEVGGQRRYDRRVRAWVGNRGRGACQNSGHSGANTE